MEESNAESAVEIYAVQSVKFDHSNVQVVGMFLAPTLPQSRGAARCLPSSATTEQPRHYFSY